MAAGGEHLGGRNADIELLLGEDRSHQGDELQSEGVLSASSAGCGDAQRVLRRRGRPLSLLPALRLSAPARSFSCPVVSVGIPSCTVAPLGCVERGELAGEHPEEGGEWVHTKSTKLVKELSSCLSGWLLSVA